MKVVAIVSAKGGVGKTTLTANLATALSRSIAAPVLAVDLDPQNALGLHLGMSPHELRGLSRSTLANQPLALACLPCTPTLHVLPYGALDEADRVTLEAAMDQDPHWLARHLASLDLPPDAVVFLDTPPGPSVYLRQALCTADVVVVVVLSDAASYATLPLMQRLVDTYYQPQGDLTDAFYVLNQLHSGKVLSKDIASVMRENLGNRLLGAIHDDEAVCEALACDTNTLDYAPYSQAAADFMECAEKIKDILQRRVRLP